jgi:hypothetical protein
MVSGNASGGQNRCRPEPLQDLPRDADYDAGIRVIPCADGVANCRRRCRETLQLVFATTHGTTVSPPPGTAITTPGLGANWPAEGVTPGELTHPVGVPDGTWNHHITRL